MKNIVTRGLILVILPLSLEDKSQCARVGPAVLTLLSFGDRNFDKKIVKMKKKVTGPYQ